MNIPPQTSPWLAQYWTVFYRNMAPLNEKLSNVPLMTKCEHYSSLLLIYSAYS